MSESGVRSTAGAIADAVGHCVIVFVFLPALAALPSWLAFEAGNRLNLEDGVLAAFVPVRGTILLLHAFRAGMLTGIVAGSVAGLLVTAWVRWRGVVDTWSTRLGVGAVAGAVAAAVGMLVGVAIVAAEGTVPSVPASVIAFELATGVVCGMVATPRALRLLAASTRADASA